jgi:hypothetical protein
VGYKILATKIQEIACVYLGLLNGIG